MSYMFNINITVLHISTMYLGLHQALMNMTQVIKISVMIQIRILATDGCIASEYIFIY
jgi:hypothetical protein